jgi:ATP-dependent helicase YprA (DUF1998 family)
MRTERMRRRFPPGGGHSSRRTVVLLSLLLVFAAPPATSPAAPAPDEADDSCVECHRGPGLFVTNRKLYDYFEKWTSSVHKQEDVTCVDCHGGNPELSDKEAAHAGDLSGSGRGSAVNFRNIPTTCGECHDEIYEGFRRSSHFEHVRAKKQEDQGPTCVTCHGSINVSVLNVNTVEETCSRCHNEESDNHGENPGEARALLNRLLSIHRYYRYITVRGDPVETREFFEKVDAQLHDLSVTWHTFDLEKIREQTERVLAELKQKREEVAKLFKERRRSR